MQLARRAKRFVERIESLTFNRDRINMRVLSRDNQLPFFYDRRYGPDRNQSYASHPR